MYLIDGNGNKINGNKMVENFAMTSTAPTTSSGKKKSNMFLYIILGLLLILIVVITVYFMKKNDSTESYSPPSSPVNMNMTSSGKRLTEKFGFRFI